MGFTLNPFKSKDSKKADSKNSLSVPGDNLAPTKSTASIANSIRSVQEKFEHLTEGGQAPPDTTKEFATDLNGKKTASIEPMIIGGVNQGTASTMGLR